MSCIVITRGGSGDIWMFASRVAADEHAIPQFGDAYLENPSHVLETFQPQELPGMAYRLGDERLRSDLEFATSGGKRKVTPDLAKRLWDVLVENSSSPPGDAEEVLRIVANDRRATRTSGLIHRKDPEVSKTETKTKDKAEKAAKPKAAGVGRANFASTSKITFGKDKDGKSYSPDNNPKRAGSGAHERFKLYKSGMTIAQAREVGITAGDINWDAKQGFIIIT